nr:hypothetical protein [Streptomyces antibioticus]
MSTSPPITLPQEKDTRGPGAPGALGRTVAALRRALRPGRVPRPDPRDLDDCRRERERWQRHADSYERELTRVRLDHAHLLAWLAALHPASAVLAPDSEAGPGGVHRLRIEAGGRQLSWRLHPADLPLFAHTPYAPHALAADGPPATDQAAHLRHHTRLLALEATLFTEPTEPKAPAPPPKTPAQPPTPP